MTPWRESRASWVARYTLGYRPVGAEHSEPPGTEPRQRCDDPFICHSVLLTRTGDHKVTGSRGVREEVDVEK